MQQVGVTQPNNVTLLRHVFSCGYVGGNDLEPLTLEGTALGDARLFRADADSGYAQ